MGKTCSTFCSRYPKERRAVVILTVHRILHAGYQIADQNHRLIFDPILTEPFSGNCYSYPKTEFVKTQIESLEASAILISHVHEDHFCLESLSFFSRNIPIFIFSEDPESKRLIQCLSFQSVQMLELGHTYQFGKFLVTPQKALDENLDCLFSIQHGDVHILNVVDAWIHPDSLPSLVQKAPWDLVLWPFQNMQEIEVLGPEFRKTKAEEQCEIPEELKSDLLALQPKTLIPSSCQFKFEAWSWYNDKYFPISYSSFHSQIEALLPNTKVERLDQGMGLSWAQNKWIKTEDLSWVKRIQNQVQDEINDYKFDQTSLIPGSDEVSRHFPELTDPEKNQVLSYLETEMLAPLRQQAEDLHPYFRQCGQWQLRLYDSEGCATEIRIELPPFHFVQSNDPLPILWTTSIPFWTAFMTLTQSASLSSSYLRVNEDLSPLQRSKLPDGISPLDDLLIRTLFAQPSLAFQKNQLQKLLTCDESLR